MNQGKFVFSQVTAYMPQRQFERIMNKYTDRTSQWSLTAWNQLLVLMFGQLDGCSSLRELTDITTAHARKSFHLGFGSTPINRTQLSKVNQLRDYRICFLHLKTIPLFHFKSIPLINARLMFFFHC